MDEIDQTVILLIYIYRTYNFYGDNEDAMLSL